MKKINKFMLIGIICVITGLSVVNSLTGHGIRNNPFLNALVLGTGTWPGYSVGTGGTGTSTEPAGYTERRNVYYEEVNRVVVWELVRVTCSEGGPMPSCTTSCQTRTNTATHQGRWQSC